MAKVFVQMTNISDVDFARIRGFKDALSEAMFNNQLDRPPHNNTRINFFTALDQLTNGDVLAMCNAVESHERG